jgi:hypothetical protein
MKKIIVLTLAVVLCSCYGNFPGDTTGNESWEVKQEIAEGKLESGDRNYIDAQYASAQETAQYELDMENIQKEIDKKEREALKKGTIEEFVDVVYWPVAKAFIGEEKYVCGRVVNTYYAVDTDGNPTFIDVGKAYPDPNRFTVVVWGSNRINFPENFENELYQKELCFQGLIYMHEGVVYMEIGSGNQVYDYWQ